MGRSIRATYYFRYCLIDRDPAKACLFSIEVPVAHKKGAPCYISQWNINKYIPIYVQAVYVGTLSCMDIRYVLTLLLMELMSPICLVM